MESADPNIEIEEIRTGYVRYRHRLTGRRWEVRGRCDKRGDCVVGAVFTHPDGSVIQVESLTHLKQLTRPNSKWRDIVTSKGLDTPVTPEFDTCCGGAGLLAYTELLGA